MSVDDEAERIICETRAAIQRLLAEELQRITSGPCPLPEQPSTPQPRGIDFEVLEQVQDTIAAEPESFPGDVLAEYDESLPSMLFAAPPLSKQRERPN